MKVRVKVIIAIFIFIAMSVSIQRYAERCNRSNIEYAEVDDFQEECNLGNTN